MRWLVNYLRSVFCKHDWEKENGSYQITSDSGHVRRSGMKVSATCKKCGWHKSYWKF